VNYKYCIGHEKLFPIRMADCYCNALGIYSDTMPLETDKPINFYAEKVGVLSLSLLVTAQNCVIY